MSGVLTFTTASGRLNAIRVLEQSRDANPMQKSLAISVAVGG